VTFTNYLKKAYFGILGLGTLFKKPAHLILMRATQSQGKRSLQCVWENNITATCL